MRVILIVGLYLFQANFLYAQYYSPPVKDLYDLEHKIRKGSKPDLIKLCEYVNDTQRVVDRLGYHQIQTTKGAIAIRLLRENTFFLDQEIVLNDSNQCVSIKDKILSNAGKIHYDKSIDAFIITPLKNRYVISKVRELTESEKTKAKRSRSQVMSANWLKHTGIVKLINDHNPFAMAAISELMLKKRNRYNEYDFDADRYTDLIALMTGYSVGVPDLHGKITYHMEGHYDDEYGTVRLNYAIYWLANFQNYKWNAITGLFENKAVTASALPNEYSWFQQLEDKSDDIAITAFTRLTESDCGIVNDMIMEFGTDKHNRSLPTFYDRFLIQMCELTRYCRSENIDYKGSQKLKQNLTILRQNHLPFAHRYAIENELINTLTVDDITAVEYWGMIYENYSSTYSIGRVLDKFYSRNWNKITLDKKQLLLYLKKAALYDRLGIIGSCNFYLTKFANSDNRVLTILRAIDDEKCDREIKNSINRVLTKEYWAIIESKKKADSIRIAEYRSREKNTWPDNMRDAPVVKNIEDSLRRIYNSHLTKDKKSEKIRDMTYLSTYSQLPIAITYLLKISDNDFYFINRILQNMFGITTDYIDSVRDVSRFLQNYNKMDELSLYRYYLKQAGIVIQNESGELDYEKIYSMLKYDYVMAFVGGGNFERKTGIFAVTKILEQQLGVKFELPEKNEHWVGNTFHSFTAERRKNWLFYLRDHNFVKEDKEPPSFYDSRVY